MIEQMCLYIIEGVLDGFQGCLVIVVSMELVVDETCFECDWICFGHD